MLSLYNDLKEIEIERERERERERKREKKDKTAVMLLYTSVVQTVSVKCMYVHCSVQCTITVKKQEIC